MRKPDIWGRCPLCARWFACPDWFEREREHPTCPTCGVEPTRIENRATRPTATSARARQYREDLQESLGNALSYTRQLWGLSRTLSANQRMAGVAERLHELETVLETELRRARMIAGELERLSGAPSELSAELGSDRTAAQSLTASA